MRNLRFIVPMILLCRCSSLPLSIGIGAGAGAAAGAVASKAAHFNTKGLLVVGAGGALLGGLIGYILHKPEPTGSSSSDEAPFIAPGQEPVLEPPEKDMFWVPGTIQNEKYVEPHRVWVIRSPGHWAHPTESNEKGVTPNGRNQTKKPAKKPNQP